MNSKNTTAIIMYNLFYRRIFASLSIFANTAFCVGNFATLTYWLNYYLRILLCSDALMLEVRKAVQERRVM